MTDIPHVMSKEAYERLKQSQQQQQSNNKQGKSK